jgi:putative membrane-bound dehydrogenase-like protein
MNALRFPSGIVCALLLSAATAWPAEPAPSPFASERARAAIANFPSRGARADSSVPLRSPAETVASFKLMPGLQAEAVLHEPEVTQPLHLSFDERGRLWVVQFIQYPYPAGLKIVDVGDQFHATYDKVPPPPPHHDRGRDRITIHEDTNGDGTFDKHKVFLDGLNMVTSVARGRGGVWVLNPPYLLFYPDANNDDVPDGDPVVHLAGFGLEDTHSAANNLQWGPDGWLYGAQGSGVTAKIRRPGLDAAGAGVAFKGQAIWRYHPERHLFELFAEGGGNTFGLTMDAEGRIFAGTNGANTRGYYAVQGGNYQKSWGEHGYLTNPYAFGYFGPLPHSSPAARFSNTSLFYEDGLLGDAFENRLIAANALARRVDLTERIPVGSTYRTNDVGAFLVAEDRWFRPVDIKVGPDGAIYLADWCDTRLTHMDPRDNWDHDHGRVYRVRAAAAASGMARFDLSQKSSAELVALLSHRQSFFRSTALRLLADRRDSSVVEQLSQLARQSGNPHALDALWGWHASGGFNPAAAAELLDHTQAAVRRWTVRLLGDTEQPIPASVQERLAQLARSEQDAQVRSQLASSARRLPGDAALPVIFALLDRREDANDPYLPLQVWWALEHFAESHREQILAEFARGTHWEAPLARSHVLSRLAQRYAARPSPENQQTLARLAQAAPESARALLRQGVAAAFEGRGIGKLSPAMEAALFDPNAHDFSDPAQMSLAIKRGDQAALVAALGFIVREEAPLAADRVRIIQALADARAEAAKPVLLEVLARTQTPVVREAALAALGRYDDKNLASELMRLWANLDGATRQRALALMVSRRPWARDLLNKTGHDGVISKADIPDEIAQRARLLGDPEIAKLVDRHFGRPQIATSEEKQRRIDELTKLLARAGATNPAAGRATFEARCAACHTLYGRGGNIGPDLTSYERTNLPNLLLSIVDPSIGIREGYATYQITTKDQRTLVGFIAERDNQRLVLRDPTGQQTTIAAGDLATEQVIPTSLMPEGLLEGLKEQELRDLFAYLASTTDPTGK